MRCAVALLAISINLSLVADEPTYKAGVAVSVITPSEYIWMAGYAGRKKPAEGKQHELFAKALALEDSAGTKIVFVGTDLIGLPRSISSDVAADVAQRTGLPRERLMLTSSHTHCGPVLRDNLMDMYDMTPEMRGMVQSYSRELRRKLVDVVASAIKDLKPAQLHHGEGKARFAINRRQATGEKGVVIGVNSTGPVDHSVPVLRVTTPEGKLRAVVFGYACHNTTLDFYDWCGDYAGFAQSEFESKHPGCAAMFWSGCGGDANPNPRRTLELAKKHGKELAGAVDDVVSRSDMKTVRGAFVAKYAEISLPLGPIPDRDKWVADTKGTNFAARTRAARFLKLLDAGDKIPDHYPHYPVQHWRLGDVAWIALGGEVVVDYVLRIKKELPTTGPVWVAAYANDVMAYIPSLRVLKEGGYEADSSMIYYGMPTKWGERIEELIMAKVKELAR